MPGFWQRFASIGLLIVLTAIIWAAADAVIAMMLCSIVLLLWVIHHIYCLTSLERWLQNSELCALTVPDSFGTWGNVFARLARIARNYSHTHQQLIQALDRMQRAISVMPEGIVILDEMGHIEWCNPTAERHLGLNLTHDLGQRIINIVRQKQFAEYLAGADFSQPLWFKQWRQQDLILSIQLVPYGAKEKLLISRDITRFEKIEIMRRDFIANVSHELRSPLTVIGGFLETLSDKNTLDSSMEKHALVLMTDQASRMQRLIEDLLTLSRLENEQNTLREEKVDITELLRKLYQEAQSLSAGRHQISLNLATQAQLSGNASELQSAFGNLISNAVRYTPAGGKIQLNWMTQNNQGLFYVQDSGIGIESQYISRLTERFFRVDRSRSRETGGTGLGLAIVKHVLSRHQARLEIISEVNKGSIFKAWFPATRLIKSNTEVAVPLTLMFTANPIIDKKRFGR